MSGRSSSSLCNTLDFQIYNSRPGKQVTGGGCVDFCQICFWTIIGFLSLFLLPGPAETIFKGSINPFHHVDLLPLPIRYTTASVLIPKLESKSEASWPSNGRDWLAAAASRIELLSRCHHPQVSTGGLLASCRNVTQCHVR
jgi:hypothetical protein